MNGLWTFGIVLTSLGFLTGGWLSWQLLRQNGRLLLRLEELEKRLDEFEFGEVHEPERMPVGTEAPAFELVNLAGERQSLAQFRAQPVLMIFFNPDCGFCRDLVSKLAAVAHSAEPRSSGHESAPSVPPGSQSRLTSAATGEYPLPLIITTGDAEKNRQFFSEHKVGCPVLLQRDGEIAKAYQVKGTPAGYLVSAEGKIASELAVGAEALLELAEGKAENGKLEAEMDQPTGGNGDGGADRFGKRSLSRSKIKRDGLKAGTPAPDFRLPRLDGCGDLSLTELRGRRVLLVFSRPGCGPCDTLAPQLEQFHRKQPEIGVVMISKGEPRENRAKVKEHGLTFPVVLQQQWEISRRYAMFATPIAYVIDQAGIITHDVAIGADAILELAKPAPAASESLLAVT